MDHSNFDLVRAFRDFDKLAQEEYGASVEELLANDRRWDGGDYEYLDAPYPHDALWRIGRLAGIAIKRPFALPREYDSESDGVSQTGAARYWELVDEATFLDSPARGPEYQLVERFLSHEEPVGEFDWLAPLVTGDPQRSDIYRFLDDVHSERGAFRAFAVAARKYLCDDPDTAAAVGSARGSIDFDAPTFIATGAADTVARCVVNAVPWLDGPVPELFLVGLILAILSQGLDGFCSRPLPPPITGQVET
jgi:hypothetical protein